MSIYTVVFVAIFCGFVGGGLFHAVFNWGLYRMALGFEYRLTDLEGRVTRETKIRASTASRTKKEAEQELLQESLNLVSGQNPATPSLAEWTKQKFKAQG